MIARCYQVNYDPGLRIRMDRLEKSKDLAWLNALFVDSGQAGSFFLPADLHACYYVERTIRLQA